jgi:hypothetical protein
VREQRQTQLFRERNLKRLGTGGIKNWEKGSDSYLTMNVTSRSPMSASSLHHGPSVHKMSVHNKPSYSSVLDVDMSHTL